jgi:hypothetical protein
MIKLTNLLIEASVFTLSPKDQWEYKYDIKTTGIPWWTRRKGTEEWIDMQTKLTPEKYKEAVDKLNAAIKAKTIIKTKVADTQKVTTSTTTDTEVSLTTKRNKNGWIIPTVKTDIVIKNTDNSLANDTFIKLQNTARADLKKQLVGKQVTARYADKYVYAFSGDDTDWAQYDLNAFLPSGWPKDASGTANIRPASLSGQTIGDVYVFISYKSTEWMTFKTKFECSIVWVGGKINAWIPSSYIDVIK